MNNKQYQLKFLKQLVYIDPSWEDFFKENSNILREIEINIQDSDYTPNSPQKILKIFMINLANVRYVILGQDPYPQPKIATGLAFEVNNYNSWIKPTKNRSLTNILKSLYWYHTKQIAPLSKIRKEIETGKFIIDPPHTLFANLQKKGVLLLNTSLTCILHQPNTHSHVWKKFTDNLLDYIASGQNNLKWFLWGGEAHKYQNKILEYNNNIIIKSKHPVCNDFICTSGLNQIN